MPKLIGEKPLTPNEISKRFYKKNAEAEKARSKKWRNENREKSREIQRRSYYKNREKNLIRMRNWQKNNLDFFIFSEGKRRARINDNGVYRIISKDIKRLKNSPCVNCGSYEQIQIDHIIPVSRNGRHSIGNLQPLCKFCNLSKGSKFMFEWKKSRENN